MRGEVRLSGKALVRAAEELRADRVVVFAGGKERRSGAEMIAG